MMFEREKYNIEEYHQKVTQFLVGLVSFNNALKLYHWHMLGKTDDSQYILLGQNLAEFINYNGSLLEISYAMLGHVDFTLPETKRPESIIDCITGQIDFLEANRFLFSEAFIQSLVNSLQKTLEHLRDELETRQHKIVNYDIS